MDPSGRRDPSGHLAALRESGGSYRAIATAAGVGPMTVHAIATGRRQPTNNTAAAVLAVTPAILRRARVDAGGTRLRLRALHVMGHTCARIARAVGASDKTIRKLLRGDAKTISLRLRDAIAEVYDAWWDKRPPERTHAERAAARAARRRAIAGNWCAGAALDDDQLDTPGYRPDHGWKPATGTGPAPDVHPPTKKAATEPGSQHHTDYPGEFGMDDAEPAAAINGAAEPQVGEHDQDWAGPRFTRPGPDPAYEHPGGDRQAEAGS
jgi:transcriptional regulator with XRE-family HTH domain